MMLFEDVSDWAAMLRGTRLGREGVLMSVTCDAAAFARRPLWMIDLWATKHTRNAARIGWKA